ncbi:MAG: hypothetical protein FJY67_05285 [Calditrichaeota bacterium]|nr:hypothetical protein [Calditrichota bacterium]
MQCYSHLSRPANRALQGLLPIIAIILIAVGCDRNPVGSNGLPPGQIASIELRASNTLLKGFRGDLRIEQLTAIGRDAQGVAVTGQRIDFAIQSPQPWKGTISSVSGDSLTDDEGRVRKSYSVQIDRSASVVIEARAGNTTSKIDLQVVVVDDLIGRLTCEASRNVLSVPPNQTRQTTVAATLVDLQGAALPGMQVRFRTDPPGLGFVDADTGTTDISGRVVRTFSTLPNKFGACAVIASIGDSSGRAEITVRPAGVSAWVSIMTPDPVVMAPRGRNVEVLLYVFVGDSSRLPVGPAILGFEVLPVELGGVTFGLLSPRDTTDQNGQCEATFQTLGSTGRVKIKVTVLPATLSGRRPDNPVKGSVRPAGAEEGDLTAELILEVRDLPSSVATLTLTASPDFLSLPPDSNGQATVRAQVRDARNVGLEGVVVRFETDLGALSNFTETDAAGIATAIFRSNYQTGEAHVRAIVPGTNLEAVARIVIRPSASETGTLILNTDRNTIYADNGLTYATLTALLSDAGGQVLAGKPLVFTKTHGTVNSPVTTDSLGLGRAIFRDIGLPSLDASGNLVPAVITARYDPLGLEAQVEITILPRNPVSRITLQSAAEQLPASGRDSTAVRATCFLENGDFAPPGTLVRFETDRGRFTSESVPVLGNYGVAETVYITGSTVGRATLRAFVQNEGAAVESNPVSIDLIPGPPRRVTVTADPDRLITNSPNSISVVTALVTDSTNNPVGAGTLVRFAASLGNITPAAVTGSDGRAESRLSAAVTAGQSEVTATVSSPSGDVVGRTTVTFVPGSPNAISLVATPLNIAVRGTGGITNSTLTATVRDANGNLIEEPTTVYFELINEPAPPRGMDINNRGQLDSAETSHGAASVTLNSGTEVGGKVVRAYTWRDEARNDTVQITLSNIMVVSGPPASLDIDVDDEGTNALGGAWKIELSARVFDLYRNPVADGIPVVFTVDPQIASVTSGYTGNLGSAGTSEPGLAYADLFYQSTQTFSGIRITATVATPGGRITGQKDHTLPLQSGVLELNIDPGNWRFDMGDRQALCNIRCWVVLRDGHGAPINNAPILFLTDNGRFWWLNNQTRNFVLFYPQTVRKLTGVVDQLHNESPGQATVYLRSTQWELFLDEITPAEDAQITASVEGYDDVEANPKFVIFTRR